MEGTCFTLGVDGSCRGLILLRSKEGHSPFSSHDGHTVVLKSGKTQPINYSRGRRGQSLAWNWARSYQSAGASEGDICLWDSLALSTSLCVCRFPLLLFNVFFSGPSLFLLLALFLSLNSLSVPPFLSLHLSLSLQSLLSFFYIALPLDILALSLCATPHPNSLPWISLASFHAFSYIICVSTSLLPSLPLALSLSWALCRFTHSCTISLCSNMFWSICSPTSRIG